MASTQIDLAQGEWAKITFGDKEGDIRQVKGSTQVIYLESPSQPTEFDTSTPTMDKTISGENLSYSGLSDGEFVWAYAITGGATISITPRSGGISSTSDFLKSMVTKLGLESSRFKVDSQPSSYEANEQFKIFYRMQEVPQNQQMVLKFESINALNIMVRKINLWMGGREYLVYGDDGSHTVTGTFTPIPVYNVNSNVQGGGAHPVSGVSASVAIGANIFVEGSEPSNGDAALTDANASRATAQPLSDTNQSGVPAGSTFYLVFNNIALNDDTTGQYYLQWEEIF